MHIELRKVVCAKDPDTWILLILDNCRVRVSRKMLKYIKGLGILLLIIPARLTWLLQMLDVYVFASLKRRMRQQVTEARLEAADGKLMHGKWFRLVGKVTQDVLVKTDWQRTFSKCGLCRHLDQVRPQIRDILAMAPDLSPSKPSEEQLREIMNMPPRALNFHVASWSNLVTGLGQTLLEEPERKPSSAAQITGGGAAQHNLESHLGSTRQRCIERHGRRT